MGQDFGLTGDLSVQVPLVRQMDLTLRAPCVVELSTVPFDQQKQILFYLIDHLSSAADLRTSSGR